ncbi:MAG: (2Fe-2S)-binding protein [Chloracidobacterium sp.]|nr:(2Fe-2S)-binding protein [Chloracidobacterium sp.]
MAEAQNAFLSFLYQLDDPAWKNVIDELQAAIHPVDRLATRVWFAFFPVKLHRALAFSPDPTETAKKLILKGKYSLSVQVDSSAEFMYGHRYWPGVKRAVAGYAVTANSSTPLAGQIRDLARNLAQSFKTSESLLVGIVAVAFGSLQQVGLDLFRQPAEPGRYGKGWNKSPEKIVEERAKDDTQGLMGIFRSVNKSFTVNFREQVPACSFKIISQQDVTMAGRNYKGDQAFQDSRVMPGEGPIPVECRSASCGTCWVGVLSDTAKVSPPNQREIERWRYFGYEGFTGDKDSPIRLACQLKASGNVTLVVPPWNGLIGRLDEKEKSATA